VSMPTKDKPAGIPFKRGDYVHPKNFPPEAVGVVREIHPDSLASVEVRLQTATQTMRVQTVIRILPRFWKERADLSPAVPIVTFRDNYIFL